jgi:membrane fusion protein, multidrug efflux system
MNLRSVTAASRADVTTSTETSLQPSSPDASGPVAVTAEPAKSKKSFVLWLIVAAVGLGFGSYFYLQRGIETTDDAQVDADVLSVPARLAGSVRAVLFEENQQVEAGQLLAELDDAPARARFQQAQANLSAARAAAQAAGLQAALAQTNAKSGLAVASAGLKSSNVSAQTSVAQIAEAQARLANAQAKLAEADLNVKRTQALFDSGAAAEKLLDQERTAQEVARTELTRSQAALDSMLLAREQAQSKIAEAQAKWSQSNQVDALVSEALARAEQARSAVATSEAQLKLAELDLNYTRIYAPVAGVVSKKTINVGQNLAVGQGIVQLVPQRYWVTANFKETQLAAMKVGQPVEIEVDTYPGHPLRGTLQSFSAATGSRFALLPPDNASGNFTKVVQRVSVRIALDSIPSELQLRPGMSVGVKIDTQQPGAALASTRP